MRIIIASAVAAVLAMGLIVAVAPRHFPTAFWFTVGFPYRFIVTRCTWASVAEGCGLTRSAKRFGRPVTYIPQLGVLRPHRHGFRVWLYLISGQTPDSIRKAASQLAHSWRTQSVRVENTAPGRVLLSVTVFDPLTNVTVTTSAHKLLTATVVRCVGFSRQCPLKFIVWRF